VNQLKQFLGFLFDIFRNRRLIYELTKKDLQSKFVGSFLGVVWAFMQPTISILIFWFVFQVGFKSTPIDDFPFILWLLCGMVPWFFISESIANATTSLTDNSFLVKKVVFRVSLLPIVKICSALVIHLFFVTFLFVMFLMYGYKVTLFNLQVIYYIFATICLVLGISWITSSIVVFVRDISQIVSMFLQFGFWLTPIFWNFKTIPSKYQWILKLNPVYYIVEGYRNSFIYNKWFWEDYVLTACFWAITLVLMGAGAFIFKRLRPHFADVL
jgi:lipopolysaccharide transport system permease protein/teichoic acid transport system permease protein